MKLYQRRDVMNTKLNWLILKLGIVAPIPQAIWVSQLHMGNYTVHCLYEMSVRMVAVHCDQNNSYELTMNGY